MKDKPIIAVLGGGVAGAATVIALARKGLKPLWIANPPDDGDRIGETLAPAGNTLLQSLGLKGLVTREKHRASNTLYSAWGTGHLQERNSIVHLEGAGWVLDRPVFDTDMHAAALPLATNHIEGQVQAFESTDTGWALTISDGRSINADFICDCTGRKSIVGSAIATRHRKDQLAAVHCFLDQIDRGIDPTPATLIETGPKGWWYAALLPNRRMVLSYFSDPDLLPKNITKNRSIWEAAIRETDYIQRWIETGGYAVKAPPILASAGTHYLDHAAGENWLAVGDAAAAFDPLSSHGLSSALWMATQAGETVAEWANENNKAAHDYSLKVLKGVSSFLDQHRKVYCQEGRFRDQLFWQRRQQVIPTKAAS